MPCVVSSIKQLRSWRWKATDPKAVWTGSSMWHIASVLKARVLCALSLIITLSAYCSISLASLILCTKYWYGLNFETLLTMSFSLRSWWSSTYIHFFMSLALKMGTIRYFSFPFSFRNFLTSRASGSMSDWRWRWFSRFLTGPNQLFFGLLFVTQLVNPFINGEHIQRGAKETHDFHVSITFFIFKIILF